MATILVVEDEPAIATAVVDRLEAEGFGTRLAVDGPAAVAAAIECRPDLMVLDLNLPGFDGIEVCRQVHANPDLAPRGRIPVVMLTARGDETDMLVGLGIGADDYLTKPFSMKELVARIRAVLRRITSDPAPVAGPTGLRLDGVGSSGGVSESPLHLDPARRVVVYEGDPIHLTPTEFDLLRALHEAEGAVLTRLQLLDQVWGYRDGSGTRTVDSHIRSIRRKTTDRLIRTVHGVGYSLGPAISEPWDGLG
ncbi:MAG: response regulator transcription factor [Actinomycetia bacterium]|nr:response regulator transcription factor [Actinomycetes bacterium]MCP5030638.1 response regulator transcription factor [Actinomycetes bacterium]